MTNNGHSHKQDFMNYRILHANIKTLEEWS